MKAIHELESKIGNASKLKVSSSVAASFGTGPDAIEYDIAIDQNEPLYCICRKASYGEMIACDNDDVCFIFYLNLTVVCK